MMKMIENKMIIFEIKEEIRDLYLSFLKINNLYYLIFFKHLFIYKIFKIAIKNIINSNGYIFK